MYEPISHALLNQILQRLQIDASQQDARHFYTRLGANFYAIYSLFHRLYGTHADFEQYLTQLVMILNQRYQERSHALKQLDLQREITHNWFLSQQWVAMALYCDRFAKDLTGVIQHLDYFQELGINMLHIMPILDCPEDNNDGGYAVRDFYQLDAKIGTVADIEALASTLRKKNMLLVLDIVVNHTSDEHQWAQLARQGNQHYQHYYYTFADRTLPDQYEQSMPEVFPETAPGNFTWDKQMQRWVMTVFNQYQWDLNYHNPAVLLEMINIILYWANRGVDVLRLDAVAFLWKQLGTSCQNLPEAHWILQLMKDCCQVVAPSVLFIAEAIVAPSELSKYFGEDAINAKECEIAYNATLMALLWDAVATKNARLLSLGIAHLPEKLTRATWLNYVRCHDDIGLSFADEDIAQAGYDPALHRRFLVDYFTGIYPDSNARGLPFGSNEKTGDARISGSLASLVGLEAALAKQDQIAINQAIDYIILLHKLILSFGGIPLLYYGDAIGTLNSLEYLAEPGKQSDNRWIHRSFFNWNKAAKRHQLGSIEHRIFSALQNMITVRKANPAFADLDNRQLLTLDNQHMCGFVRHSEQQQILVLSNFSTTSQSCQLPPLASRYRELCSAEVVSGTPHLTLPALSCYWLEYQA